VRDQVSHTYKTKGKSMVFIQKNVN